MHRQQVLKCHLSDRFVAACGRLWQISEKNCHAGIPVFMRLSAKRGRCGNFFQVLKISKKNQNNKPTSKKTATAATVSKKFSIYAGLGVADSSIKTATKLSPTCHIKEMENNNE